MPNHVLDLSHERMAVLAERSFGVLESKLATALLRYRPERIVCVIDSEHAGCDAASVVGVGEGVPVVETFEEARRHDPSVLTLGIAPPAGRLPETWRELVRKAISRGLHVMSGLHHFLADDPEFAALARESGAVLWDARRPPKDLPIGSRRAQALDAVRVLTVGSDCRTGKMVTCLELDRGARQRGWSSAFCATGQNGIMIAGSGIAVDAVPSDFIAGATEEIIVAQADRGAAWLFVEGQGSLIHPAYSGVTLGLLHGALPQAMILCHMPSRTRIARHTLPIPPLTDLVTIYEDAAAWQMPAPVVGIALNTFDLSDGDAREAVATTQDATGLPTTDPVRYGVDPLLDVLAELSP